MPLSRQMLERNQLVVHFKLAVFTDSIGLGCFHLQVFRLFCACSSVKNMRGEAFSSREQLVPDTFAPASPLRVDLALS